ncbi:phosphoglycerate kinase [Candidatus Neomarinimicrobiota bacterium]
MHTVDQLDLKGQRALIRVDFNVPLDDGIVDDDFRLRAALPTIKYCLEQGASVVLMSHLGRPKGKVVEEFSLLPVAESLERLLQEDIIFSRDCISEQSIKVSRGLKAGQVHLLENLRFHPGEGSNDPEFAAKLAEHGTVFINDAFGTAHRAHASNVGVAKLFEQKAIGLLMAKEVKFLQEKIADPKKPFVVVLGGAKVAGKLELVREFLPKADRILIGGGMAFTFLKAQGANIGGSLVDDGLIDEAANVLKEAESQGVTILLPRDVCAAESVVETAPWRLTGLEELKPDEIGLDIGPETCAEFGMALQDAETILWNGPMGVFEFAPFQAGTEMIIAVIAEATARGATSVVGGGDSAAAIDRLSEARLFTHISTGGGASLELLSGKQLPAWEALA